MAGVPRGSVFELLVNYMSDGSAGWNTREERDMYVKSF
jgi:hypothetical protein